jgi:predicted Rossmann fold flavoprotein
MAAGKAAEGGAEVSLFEKMNRPGRKLSITGKGRCNLTNTASLPEFISHFGDTGKFLYQALYRFGNTALMAFLEGVGLKLVTERGGRVFPASGRAVDVLDALLAWVRRGGVHIAPSCAVETLTFRSGRVHGVVTCGKEFLCDAVILATGGASYPATGSTGDGYRLALSAGHSMVPVRPALVPLETAGGEAGNMAGLNLRNVRVRLLINGKKHKEAFGEMGFTRYGVTGPIILTLSGKAVDALRNKETVVLSIDLKPALDDQKLDARLLRDVASRGAEPFSVFLRGLLPQAIIPVCLERTKIASTRTANTMTAKERRRLRTWLKDFRLQVSRHRPIEEAIVTAGGVNTKEVDPRTMESLCAKGLFIAGELLDIHADTGGYNLQGAFSTGWLAGRCAARGK